jgi:acyl carrier protein
MHQAILARAPEDRRILERSALRLIRSSSAALAPKLMAGLEGLFRVPVIESYGMTEASHQMASNPLPPRPRKPGSVGLASGPEIAIMDGEGSLASAGITGEIVIRGPNVTLGYENNPAAKESSFSNGWFRTGDRGYLDREGYLFITGRIKELINRGGEKIAPREIDEVLLEHPDVAQAVAFAIAHEELGEEVGAAIVLKDGRRATQLEIREFAAERLADFKVPRQVLILPEIPKGPTGKVQRIGLAEKLGIKPIAARRIGARPAYIAPRNAIEKGLAELWAEVLNVSPIGAEDHFFQLGGDSVLATQLISRMRSSFQAELALLTVFEFPVLKDLALKIPAVGGKNPSEGDIQTLVLELDNLSDEEVERLLSEERRRSERRIKA